jgi:hypothetical protein
MRKNTYIIHWMFSLKRTFQPSQFSPKGLFMSAFKTLFFVKWSSSVSAGICFIVILLAILMSPGINHLQDVRAAIDETMPDMVPDSIVADWKDQDNISGSNYSGAIDSIVGKLPAAYADKYNVEKAGLSGEKLYLLACHYRRVSRMKKHEANLENIMFARHHNFGGILVGFHDNSDASNTDIAWVSKGALCVLNMKNYYSVYKELLTRTDAVVRDPCISFDGKKVLFAISGKGKGSGYKLYEMEIADTATPNQLTSDPEGLSNVADFEPCYLPDGDIMFSSTRNSGIVSGEIIPSANMFKMNGQGKYIRQVGFDQAHTFYPVLLDDGTVLYTRWEYNDRDITNCMGLFVMNPDGARQTEWFGNQTPWPFTMIHARPIPNTVNKVICVAGGHHGPYAGELMIIDQAKGFDGIQSVGMIAPKRETKPNANKSDMAAGGVNFLFQTPCPLDENDFLVSWRKSEGTSNNGIFKLYFMDVDGHRELLAWADQSVSQPVLIKPRKIPPKIAVQANYNDSMGTFTMQNVYTGEGMKGVVSGAAKSLRVVALHYRIAGSGLSSGMMMGSGPSGVFQPAISCPVSAYGGSREAKEVLGEAPIYPDGSAAFKAPARTPVYFQVIDTNGYCIATMRSWSTLMPGEKFTCIGCHESKLELPPISVKLQAGEPKVLDKPMGIENKPFDYKQMVQPIFDNKCVKCHTANHESGFDLGGTLVTSAKKSWAASYKSLFKGIPVASSNTAINICTIFSQPQQQPPRSFGSSQSGIMLTGGMSGSHHDVQVTATERKIVACWIDLAAPYFGNYNSSMSISDSTAYEKLVDKRVKWAAIENGNIKALIAAQTGVMPGDQGSVKLTRSNTKRLNIRYVPTTHALVLNISSQGYFILVDLRGKVISRMEISNQRMNGNVSIPLPASLSTGIYVAGFEGVNGILQTKVSITK